MKTSSARSAEGKAGALGSGEKGGIRFPTTQWSLFDALRASQTTGRVDVLNELMGCYWKPLYAFVRRQGCGEHDAQDIVQSFLVNCLKGDFFARAQQERGRFRTFIMTSCENFMRNHHRAERAGRRYPKGGMASLDEMLAPGEDKRAFEPKSNETPADAFNRVWACDLLKRMMALFREECWRTGKQTHYEIFEVRIVQPALEGASPPPLQRLAAKYGIDEKKAANYLLTARRAFQRLLREGMRAYVLSDEDVTAEINDLFELLARRQD